MRVYPIFKGNHFKVHIRGIILVLDSPRNDLHVWVDKLLIRIIQVLLNLSGSSIWDGMGPNTWYNIDQNIP